ncbi:ThiF family adenylyltransferase [Heliobacterium chlorum]|uniref:ThiF family adenylyltransferase n=1 Tax=Heliobacterium chlorum TaxID=2698 RepID=A0ABR7SXH7_HELCL|nr:ThiF family adenylyltransferase [Heliobacterium chlorum]MBC9783242.1 ThiF family adenylyltransferase [Heliobacterium chlorum]
MERYLKQIRFSGVGEEGQRRLLSSKVLIAGMGALGTHLANALARAGVGHLLLADRDYVEKSNLQRQVLYDEDDVERTMPKAIAAKKKLQSINSEINIEAVVADLGWSNLEPLLEGVDLVVDGSDNFDLRFLLNDACVRSAIPWIYGGVTGAHGMAMVVLPEQGPCLRCLMPNPPAPGTIPTCDTAGILGPAIQMVTAFQSVEAIKVLTGRVQDLSRGLFSVDLWTNRYDLIDLSEARRTDCPACSLREFPFLEGKEEMQVIALCGSNSVQITPARGAKLRLDDIAERLKVLGKVQQNPYLLKVSIEQMEIILFGDGRAMIKGTQDPLAAKAFYTRYVGT